MPNEQDSRRPTFAPGRVVVLADGQGWNLPLPRVRLVPSDNEAGFETFITPKSLGVDYGKLLDAYGELKEGDLVIVAELRLAAALLLANYSLTKEQVAEVMQFAYRDDDPEGARIREEVMDVALGRGPKAPAAGGGSSPTPAA